MAISNEVIDRRAEQVLSEELARYSERTPKSKKMYERAAAAMPLGVASSFQAGDPYPIYLASGAGSHVTDVDGHSYVDYHNGFGCMVVGHAHAKVRAAIEQAAATGTHFAATTRAGVEFAEELKRRFGLDKIRFTNSGTEATMDAIRCARAATGKDVLLKIEGSYHGHHDAVMYSIVAMILEPVMMNAGIILPQPGYLEKVRELCTKHNVVLIFDEVKTGVTIAPGGATEYFGVQPDMVTLAKAIGGGTPVGAFGGTAEVMDTVEHGVTAVGTFNGNPLSMAAGVAALTEVLTDDAYAYLRTIGTRLAQGCQKVLDDAGIPAVTTDLGAKGSITFRDRPLESFRDYQEIDDSVFDAYWYWVINRGVYQTPGKEEQWTISVQHTEHDIDRTIGVLAAYCAEVGKD